MGHCEMLLAVAGLNDDEVTERCKRLAEGDWSEWSAGERAAFQYARKMSKEPSAVTPEDFKELQRYFGPHRALDVLWWACRCHYMTRVADAFQLPLERDNVFENTSPAKK